MTRTLVTGAAGFTGRYLGELLAGRGQEVDGLVNGHDDSPIDGYARLHDADLLDPDALERIVDEIRPDHVVHLAGIANVAHGDVDALYRVNIVGTRNLLEALRRSGPPVTSILLASSANVYGNARAGELSEATPPSPANDYGVSKLAMEQVAAIYRADLPIIVARPFNYTGRGQSSQYLIPKIVEHARSRAPVIELGNLDVARDFSDVRTVVDAYSRLIEEPDALGGTFNVCSRSAVTLEQVVAMVVRLSGHPLEVRVNPAFVRAHEVRSLHGSRAAIESVIGPLKAIPLDDTLAWMLQA